MPQKNQALLEPFKRCIELLKPSTIHSINQNRLQEFVITINFHPKLLKMKDSNGYDLLQHAIMKKSTDAVSSILNSKHKNLHEMCTDTIDYLHILTKTNKYSDEIFKIAKLVQDKLAEFDLKGQNEHQEGVVELEKANIDGLGKHLLASNSSNNTQSPIMESVILEQATSIDINDIQSTITFTEESKGHIAINNFTKEARNPEAKYLLKVKLEEKMHDVSSSLAKEIQQTLFNSNKTEQRKQEYQNNIKKIIHESLQSLQETYNEEVLYQFLNTKINELQGTIEVYKTSYKNPTGLMKVFFDASSYSSWIGSFASILSLKKGSEGTLSNMVTNFLGTELVKFPLYNIEEQKLGENLEINYNDVENFTPINIEPKRTYSEEELTPKFSPTIPNPLTESYFPIETTIPTVKIGGEIHENDYN
jgi:hypothetical protein